MIRGSSGQGFEAPRSDLGPTRDLKHQGVIWVSDQGVQAPGSDSWLRQGVGRIRE